MIYLSWNYRMAKELGPSGGSFPADRIVVIFDKKRSLGTDMIKKMRRLFGVDF
jgi:antitoxin component HigA of HigAB toxin-antitoxin module